MLPVELPMGLHPVELPMGLQPGVGSRAWMAFSSPDELARTASFVMPPVPPSGERLASPADVEAQKAAYYRELEDRAKQHQELVRAEHGKEMHALVQAVEAQRGAIEVELNHRVVQLETKLNQQLMNVQGSHQENQLALEQQAADAVRKFNERKVHEQNMHHQYQQRREEFDDHMKWCVDKAVAPLAPTPAAKLPGAALAVGDIAEGFWDDGKWYPARVDVINEDGTYTVIWLEDGSWSRLPLGLVRRVGECMIVPAPLTSPVPMHAPMFRYPSPVRTISPVRTMVAPQLQGLDPRARYASPPPSARLGMTNCSPMRYRASNVSPVRSRQTVAPSMHVNSWPISQGLEPSTIALTHRGYSYQPTPRVLHSGPMHRVPSRGSLAAPAIHAQEPMSSRVSAAGWASPAMTPRVPPPPVMLHQMEPSTLTHLEGCCTPRMSPMEPIAWGQPTSPMGSRPLTRDELIHTGVLHTVGLPKPCGPSPLDRDF